MSTVIYTRHLVEHRYGRPLEDLRRHGAHGGSGDPVLPIVLRRLDGLATTNAHARAARRNLDAATRGVFGDPMSPSTKDSALTASRAFFRDVQEWEWIPRRFDPGRALETPRSIRALLGPNPRVIADEVWAKLLWAGINLTSEDLPTTSSGPRYPLELSRAVALTWLFSG
ncbi:hypothetical protein [Streptomyces canus]|uniref:hypothetical protein n=1 Tax=Streptomyces canus TaxID=58343 RepID=UPI002E3045A8|nr:hypothetical protein [Streptomyces canus]